MSLAQFLAEYEPHVHFTAFVLGSARLSVFFMTAPFFGNAVAGMVVRSAVVLALYLIVHPMVLASVAPLMPAGGVGWVLLVALLLKEIFLGFVLGWLAGLAFWAVESAGLFIDNQRGASQASLSDPLSGDQSSPTGAFMLQSTCYAFFASGAFAAMLGLIYSTYECWPVGELLPSALFTKPGAALFFGERMAGLAALTVLISAPIVLACLFADAALGLVNRFAPQLNVYVISMPVKCGVGSFLLLFYFAVLMTDAAERFAAFGIDLATFRAFIP